MTGLETAVPTGARRDMSVEVEVESLCDRMADLTAREDSNLSS